MKIILLCLSVFLSFAQWGYSEEEICDVNQQSKWRADHPCNGKIVELRGEYFPNPEAQNHKTHSEKLEFLGRFLPRRTIQNDKGDDIQVTGPQIYIYSKSEIPCKTELSSPLLLQSTKVKLRGVLKISEFQVKGGEYPVVLEVQKPECE